MTSHAEAALCRDSQFVNRHLQRLARFGPPAEVENFESVRTVIKEAVRGPAGKLRLERAAQQGAWQSPPRVVRRNASDEIARYVLLRVVP